MGETFPTSRQSVVCLSTVLFHPHTRRGESNFDGGATCGNWHGVHGMSLCRWWEVNFTMPYSEQWRAQVGHVRKCGRWHSTPFTFTTLCGATIGNSPPGWIGAVIPAGTVHLGHSWVEDGVRCHEPRAERSNCCRLRGGLMSNSLAAALTGAE